MGKEATFQKKVVDKLGGMFPGSFIIRNDPQRNQGVPDVLILVEDRWAMLEFKKAPNARRQPNQGYHVNRFNDMSFAAFIHPENEEKVLHDLQSALGAKG